MKYLSIDTETGGLDLDVSLLEIGLVLADENFNELDSRVIKVKPDCKKGGRTNYIVQAEALAINGINLVEHDKVAHPYQVVGTKLYEIFAEWVKNEKLIPTGKNVHFDLKHIWDKTINRSTWEQFVSYQIMDVTSVWRFLTAQGKVPTLQSSSLSAIAEHYKLDTSGLHGSLFDARLTLSVLKELSKI